MFYGNALFTGTEQWMFPVSQPDLDLGFAQCEQPTISGNEQFDTYAESIMFDYEQPHSAAEAYQYFERLKRIALEGS